MDFIVNKPDPLLDAFFDKFNSVWSRPNQGQGFRAYTLGLLSEAHRKNIEALGAGRRSLEKPATCTGRNPCCARSLPARGASA